jgi:hypothetical protein
MVQPYPEPGRLVADAISRFADRDLAWLNEATDPVTLAAFRSTYAEQAASGGAWRVRQDLYGIDPLAVAALSDEEFLHAWAAARFPVNQVERALREHGYPNAKQLAAEYPVVTSVRTVLGAVPDREGRSLVVVRSEIEGADPASGMASYDLVAVVREDSGMWRLEMSEGWLGLRLDVALWHSLPPSAPPAGTDTADH